MEKGDFCMIKEETLKKYSILIAIAISFVLLLIGSLFSWDDNPVMGLDKACADIAIVLICFFLIKKFDLWDNSGFKKAGFAKGMLYGIPFIVIGICSAVISNMSTDWSSLQLISFGNTVLFSINMLLVGMNEEIWMRSLILNLFLKKYGRTKKGVWTSIILSAVVFGVIHIPNIAFMNPITLIVQVINAASAGVLFAAIFICSKNIWAGMVTHAAVDWLALFIANCYTGGSSVLSISMSIPQAAVMILLGSLPPIVIAVFYLKRYFCLSIKSNQLYQVRS